MPRHIWPTSITWYVEYKLYSYLKADTLKLLEDQNTLIRYDPNVLDPKSYCEIKLKCQFPTVIGKYSNGWNNRVLYEHMIRQTQTKTVF